MLACFVAANAWCGATRPDPQVARPDLSEDDLDELQNVFEKMSECFLSGNAEGIKRLLALSEERDGIVDTLKREFKEARYFDFQVERPLPDNKLSANRHSVDVTIRVKLLYLNDLRRPEDRNPIENTTFQSFVVQREANGKFRIVNSPFFDNMGRRGGGMGSFVITLFIIGIVICVLFLFWIWMASEAWFIRPRSKWRWVAAIPVAGSAVFFFFRYLPRWWRKKK